MLCTVAVVPRLWIKGTCSARGQGAGFLHMFAFGHIAMSEVSFR